MPLSDDDRKAKIFKGKFMTGGCAPEAAVMVRHARDQDRALRHQYPEMVESIRAAGPVPDDAKLVQLARERRELEERMATIRAKVEAFRTSCK